MGTFQAFSSIGSAKWTKKKVLNLSQEVLTESKRKKEKCVVCWTKAELCFYDALIF